MLEWCYDILIFLSVVGPSVILKYGLSDYDVLTKVYWEPDILIVEFEFWGEEVFFKDGVLDSEVWFLM